MKRQRHTYHRFKTPRDFIGSIRSFWVTEGNHARTRREISILVVLAIFVMTSWYNMYTCMCESRNSQVRLVTDSEWFVDNLYKVDSFKSNGNDIYGVVLLQIEPAPLCSFEELCEIFLSTPYSTYNSYLLKDGVNCQGMTVYLADWCDKTATSYTVDYSPVHTAINIEYEDETYQFSFTKDPSIIKISK